MHRHVRGVGDQRAVRVEHGAGEIQPLLDVHAGGRALQHHAHFLGHRHEAAVEQLQIHRIGDGGVGLGRAHCLDMLQRQHAVGQAFGPPAGVQEDLRLVGNDQRGAGRRAARSEFLQPVDRDVGPFAVQPGAAGVGLFGFSLRRGRGIGRARAGRIAHGVGGDRLDLHRAAMFGKAE